MKHSKFFVVAAITALTSGCSGQSSSNSNTKKAIHTSKTNRVVTCDDCGKTSCDRNCTSNDKTVVMKDQSKLKNTLPSCNLSESQLVDRKAFLQSGLASKIKEVKELPTGYDLVFIEPKEFSTQLLEFINFERGCCSSFSYALVFEPNNKATHLQIYGSKEIKTELSNGFKELGFIK